MHCWVNKGAKGIALIDDDTYSGLKYVFHISDVTQGKANRTVSKPVRDEGETYERGA